MTDTISVAGEPAAALFEIIRKLPLQRQPSGRWSIDHTMPPAEGAMLARAIMRIEAELMMSDADQVGRDESSARTPDERRADALVALVLRVCDAMQSSA
jgi:Domain of unknown function (DUF222)